MDSQISHHITLSGKRLCCLFYLLFFFLSTNAFLKLCDYAEGIGGTAKKTVTCVPKYGHQIRFSGANVAMAMASETSENEYVNLGE